MHCEINGKKTADSVATFITRVHTELNVSNHNYFCQDYHVITVSVRIYFRTEGNPRALQSLRVESNHSRPTSIFSHNHTASNFLGALAKLRNASISFVMSVRLSAQNKSSPTKRIFMKFHISGIFLKSA
jgi:ABC-type Zn uptake system ZnuABC Zn-binding protein ZnuA